MPVSLDDIKEAMVLLKEFVEDLRKRLIIVMLEFDNIRLDLES